MDKGPIPNRVVYLSYASANQMLAEELKECLATTNNYPVLDFSFSKPMFTHFWSMNPTLSHLRIEDADCVVLIWMRDQYLTKNA